MRYLILAPTDPIDPRHLELKSSDALHELAPVVMDCASEKHAAQFVRNRYPEAVAMPVPVTIGSGKTVFLGFVDDPSRKIDPDAPIPFVMFVQCVPQKAAGFTREFWKIPVVKPEMAKTHQIDLRHTDLDVPVFTEARVGTHNGRLAIHVEIGGVEFSIRFQDPRAQLVLMSGPPGNVTLDVRDSGETELKPVL